MKIMMVCTGNICRSAMAEAVLKQQLERLGITGIDVASCGISDEEHGNPIDRRAAQILHKHGYDAPTGHHAKQVKSADFSEFDLFLAMTSQHYEVLERLLNRVGGEAKIEMYREYDTESGYLNSKRRRDLDVPDPWYGDLTDFEDTLAVIERVTPQLIARYGRD